jgi:ABC-type glycerol-3-phosphate transport system permease component
MIRALAASALNALVLAIAAVFLLPFVWMVSSAFRTQEAILSNPLRILPEQLSLDAFAALGQIGGVPLTSYALNSVLVTCAATILGVTATALGAYALWRGERWWFFRAVRGGFLISVMYPNLLLVIPIYFVVFKLGLLGTRAAIILAMSLLPIVFFTFVQFFRSVPRELIEAARMDGASELQLFRLIVLPVARPVIATTTLIAFLLNWKHWFPALVISVGPETYTLPIALLQLNSEYGVNIQATMALAALTTVPIVLLFLIAQKHVVSGFVAGAVKG